VVQNNDTMLKVSRLLATGLEILVANAKFLVALATSWSQFRTLTLDNSSEWSHIKSTSCSLLTFLTALLGTATCMRKDSFWLSWPKA